MAFIPILLHLIGIAAIIYAFIRLGGPRVIKIEIHLPDDLEIAEEEPPEDDFFFGQNGIMRPFRDPEE
ncbi:MAG: hypothetical protein ACOYD6_01350 [Limnochordia bacterium]|jgi:hypothetical protein